MNLAEQPTLVEHTQYNPEIRHKNDAETWLAEVLDGTMRTPFEYSFDGYELYAEDGSAMGAVFQKSEEDAPRIAKANPRLGFEMRRRRLESEEYADMLAMARGELPNTMIVVSDFPPEMMTETKSIGGYNVDRKQTMLRVITWDGKKITMQSQSLDLSNRLGLESLYDAVGCEVTEGELLGQRMHVDVTPENQPFVIDQLVGVYDRALELQYGGEWYAGRSGSDRQNTYDFVRCNQDIVQRAAELFAQGIYNSAKLYDCAATLKRRLIKLRNGEAVQMVYAAIDHADHAAQQRLHQEMQYAGTESRMAGDTFDGCGVSVSGVADQLNESGYGNKSNEDGDCDFTSKQCPKCNERNVRTIVRKRNGKKHISGSCGCTAVVSV